MSGRFSVLMLVMLVGACTACTYIPRPMQSVAERMDNDYVGVAFLGNATRTRNIMGFAPFNIYEVTFDVACVFKSQDGIGLGSSVTVSGFGNNGGMCIGAYVSVGEMYVILASDSLNVANVNIQSGAIAATSHLINEINLDKNTVCSMQTTA